MIEKDLGKTLGIQRSEFWIGTWGLASELGKGYYINQNDEFGRKIKT